MQNETNVIEQEKVEIKLPNRFKVIFWNDDITPMGFVVELLVNIFNYDRSNAIEKMLEVHETGKSVVGIYLKAIAESKATLVREVSIKANYPLKVTVEEEE